MNFASKSKNMELSGIEGESLYMNNENCFLNAQYNERI